MIVVDKFDLMGDKVGLDKVALDRVIGHIMAINNLAGSMVFIIVMGGMIQFIIKVINNLVVGFIGRMVV